ITAKYGHGTGDPDRNKQKRVQFLIEQLDSDVIARLWRWFDQYGITWARALGFPENIVELLPPFEPAASADGIRRCLSDFSDYYNEREYPGVEAGDIARDLHYRGLILTADHAASAGSPPFPSFSLTPEIARQPLEAKGRALNPHQERAAALGEGSAILIAPTGSGKTEAALLWAAYQIERRPASRLFYTLPYQASMNAMEDRLKRDFFHDADVVTVQHSRATLKYYRDLMDADSGAENPRAAAAEARGRKDQAKLNYYPVQVFSPYQMLKAAFRLKGYEPLVVDYTGALFIFDEIHAYDAQRLALIITTIGWLAQHYHARFLIMTATLPPMVMQALKTALPGCAEIRANDATFQSSQRHEVHLRHGDLTDQLDTVLAEWQAQHSTLVCCNTVKRAQSAYIELKRRFETLGLDPKDHVLLLHGRFNGKDRWAKEQRLMKYIGVDMPKAARKPMIVVATQVVEVSLNLDFDTLYTDPAPLEALLQRFGRVNRGRAERSLCPVYVFDQPLGEKESLPYDHRIVARSLEVLAKYCPLGAPIDERMVTQMLGEIYQGEIETVWWTSYRQQAQTMQQTLNDIIPYQSADWELEQKFYQLFDGVEVLPTDSYAEWEQAVENEGYLGASQYLINIRWAQLGMLKGKGLILPQEEDQYFYQTCVHYDSEFGLDLNNQLGGDDGL
ncbi:MAG TPA: CRISPR-associated helicase Cas3', partial [Phototrophicaceae bacterium]|nr:CRISPR-associated helicase Cas3' [Phototrophicaceae bacterium]